MNNSISTSCDPLCAYCGKPVIANSVWGASGPYHAECVQSPYATLVRILPMRRMADEELDDGFGNSCSKRCPACGKMTMEVVRPGTFQCSNCYDGKDKK